jgi:DNA-binding SARP family transcriptional activator/TolB-like protein/Tfp pilus assembly protein PilF
MVEITLLGRVSVQVDGQAVSGEAAQRRRLALLALLADPPLRPVSRDRLMLHLWPENGTDSARHLLSAALHVLRKALGPEVLRSSAEYLELSADRVRIDVAEFEQAVQGGDPEHALSLYGGPFLEGLFLSESPEFEQWRDGRRAELAGLYARVLEGAAEARAAAGRLDAAVEAWRRLAAHDPFSSRGVMGLMRALTAAGNRAGALQAARVHEQLLDAEFEAMPDPEVLRLAEELRREPVAPATPGIPATPATPAIPATPDASAASETLNGMESAVAAPSTGVPQPIRQAPLARRTRWLAALLALGIGGALMVWLGARSTGQEVIAVVPRAGPGTDSAADYLSYGIAETVDYELGRLGGLRVLNTGSSFLYRDSVLDPREIGRRLSADLLVTVSARMTAGAPRVRIELIRASNGQRIWEEQYDGAAVHGASGDAVAGIGRALQLGPPVASAPGHRAATTSTEAYTLYQQGRYAWSRRTPEALLQAVTLLQRASDMDPSYPWPHVGLADAYNMMGSYDYGVLPPDSAYPLARRAARRALELAPDLAPAHAALANVQVNHDWDWDEAEAGFRRAISLNAGYTPASEWLANLMIARDRMPEALALLRGALEYNPASALIYTGLAHYHYYARAYVQAHAYLDRAMEIDPAFGRAHLVRALVLCMEGSHAAAIRILEPMAATSRATDPILVALLGYAYGRSGRITEARAELDWLRALAATRFVPAEYEAIIHVGLGDEHGALDRFEAALARRSSAMIYLDVDPIVDPLRGTPRFQRILAAVSPRS